MDRSLGIFADFITGFASRIPDPWTSRIPVRGKLCACVVSRGFVDLTSFLAIVGSELACQWDWICESHVRLARSTSIMVSGFCSLGEFVGVLLRVCSNRSSSFLRTEIWETILPVTLRHLTDVILHYTEYVSTEDRSNLPSVRVQKQDSLLIYAWICSLLKSSRRNLPERAP